MGPCQAGEMKEQGKANKNQNEWEYRVSYISLIKSYCMRHMGKLYILLNLAMNLKLL